MANHSPETVFLDACVLFPPLVRSLLLSVATEGFYAPMWSARVLEEWRRAAERKQGAGEEAETVAARMNAVFPGAQVPSAPDLEASIELPDPADAHVVAAAAAAGAQTLLTFNLRDFPQRILANHSLAVRHPDSFLWETFSKGPEPFVPLVEAVLGEFEIGPGRARSVLKRARLSRFGKAWEARKQDSEHNL